MNIFQAIWLPASFTITTILMADILSWVFLIPCIFGAGDVWARYRDFRRLRGLRCKRLLRRMRHSACQRNAAIAASLDKVWAKRYYRSLGYRWYHLLPDGTFSIRDNCYLRVKFYKRLLGFK